MKIYDDVNGIRYYDFHPTVSYTSDELDEIMEEEKFYDQMHKENELAEKKWEEEGEKNIKVLINKQKPLVEQFKKDQAKAKANNKEIAYSGDSFIGERIVFLMEQNKQEIAEFCRNIGMSRSSLHRYIKGSFLPSEKSLRKIIEGLYVSVADFCYAPDDFEKWKSAFGESYEVNDIFDFKEELLSKLRINDFTYQANGATRRLPNRYFELFRNLIKDSFAILELLPHDK